MLEFKPKVVLELLENELILVTLVNRLSKMAKNIQRWEKALF